jgi:arylsulfatase A
MGCKGGLTHSFFNRKGSSGVPVNDRFDGLSLVPTLLKKGKQAQHLFYYWEFHENNGRQAVRMGKWKGVLYDASLLQQQPLQLFDLEKDPFEKTDIAAQHPKVVAEIKAIILREHVAVKDWPLLFGEGGKEL